MCEEIITALRGAKRDRFHFAKIIKAPITYKKHERIIGFPYEKHH
jgi:hypothetical protein